MLAAFRAEANCEKIFKSAGFYEKAEQTLIHQSCGHYSVCSSKASALLNACLCFGESNYYLFILTTTQAATFTLIFIALGMCVRACVCVINYQLCKSNEGTHLHNALFIFREKVIARRRVTYVWAPLNRE